MNLHLTTWQNISSQPTSRNCRLSKSQEAFRALGCGASARHRNCQAPIQPRTRIARMIFPINKAAQLKAPFKASFSNDQSLSTVTESKRTFESEKPRCGAGTQNAHGMDLLDCHGTQAC